jgi:adenylosuccinate lyase
MMNLDTLTAISPIDGRYRTKTTPLSLYFSEYALIRYRLYVEVEYLLSLCELELPGLHKLDPELLRNLYQKFSPEDAAHIKVIERRTNHDIKALEYWLKEKLSDLGFGGSKEFVHFALTSQDINNTAIPLSLKEAQQNALFPVLDQTVAQIEELALLWKHIPMLAYTHGQPASPTTVGKELAVFVYRLKLQIKTLKNLPFMGKFGGATGNFNAHKVAFAHIDWRKFADKLLQESFGLSRSQFTTQIDNYDSLAAIFDNWRRIAMILTDFCRDVWAYISLDYFKQRLKEGEVGSSAMPHKVNPIDFENAEGNLAMAVALLGLLSEKLPVSRLQRDLTDSTVLRNLGVPFGHIFIALESICLGLGKLQLNPEKIAADIQSNPAVLAEAIQTILRRENFEQPYESLKVLTRTSQKISLQALQDFVRSMGLSKALTEELLSLKPEDYTGYATDFQYIE